MADLKNPLSSFEASTHTEWTCEYTNMYGEKLPIIDIVSSISIYESIYHETVFGHLVILDNIGFCEKHGIVGQGIEKFNLSMHTNKGDADSSNFEKEFRINSYHDASFSGDGVQGVTAVMDLVSPALFKNNRTKISRSFNAMTASEIVDYIGYEVLDFGTGVWDDLQTNIKSINTKNIVVPNWSPFKLLNFLCKNSVSIEDSSNYMFFENNTGFHFSTIDDMKMKEPSATIQVSQIQKDSLKVLSKDTMSVRTNIAEKYREEKRFNHTESMTNGLYGGKLFTHNILTKSYNTYEALYDSDEFELGWAGLDGDGQFGKVSDSHIGFMPDEYVYQIHDKKDKSHYIHRDMKMAELRTNIIKFNIIGNSSLWAGDKIIINKDSKIISGDEQYDQVMSGEWIITAIHHQINKKEYVMTLECMKDSFESAPDPDVEVAKKKTGEYVAPRMDPTKRPK